MNEMKELEFGSKVNGRKYHLYASWQIELTSPIKILLAQWFTYLIFNINNCEFEICWNSLCHQIKIHKYYIKVLQFLQY